MTVRCRCGYQFCYNCGSKWKTCSCEQWDERRLLAEAQARVRRNLQENPAAGQLDAQQFQAAVNDMAEELRDNHDCQHNWVRRSPSPENICMNCNYALWVYGFVCTRHQCPAVVCFTCRYHRRIIL